MLTSDRLTGSIVHNRTKIQHLKIVHWTINQVEKQTTLTNLVTLRVDDGTFQKMNSRVPSLRHLVIHNTGKLQGHVLMKALKIAPNLESFAFTVHKKEAATLRKSLRFKAFVYRVSCEFASRQKILLVKVNPTQKCSTTSLKKVLNLLYKNWLCIENMSILNRLIFSSYNDERFHHLFIVHNL